MGGEGKAREGGKGGGVDLLIRRGEGGKGREG